MGEPMRVNPSQAGSGPELVRSKPEVDYFPSYEIVRGSGLGAYTPDHMHVKNEVVERVTSYMLQSYATQAVEEAS